MASPRASLKSSDIARLESWQATVIKSALRLPRIPHHRALVAALNILSVPVILRRALFSAFRDAFRGEHRLRDVLLSSLARVALGVTSACSTGSLVNHVLKLCGGDLERLLQIAGGRVCRELVDAPRPVCGIVSTNYAGCCIRTAQMSGTSYVS